MTALNITLATRTDPQLRHLPAFMEHHMPYCRQAVVYIDLRPGQSEEEIVAYLEKRWAGKYRAVVRQSLTFGNTTTTTELQQAIASAPPTDWVLHLDKDEFVSRIHLLPAIVEKMQSDRLQFAEGWMACRFGPGMTLYSDALATFEEFSAAAPVRVEYVKNYGFPTRKVWLAAWPHVRIHTADGGWRRHPDLMALDHFTWTHSRIHFLKEKLFWHLKCQTPQVVSDYVRYELEALEGAPEVLAVGKKTLIPLSCSLPGFFDYEDVYRFIVDRAPEGSTVVELGVYCGRSLCYMAEYATLIGKQLDIVGIDLFDLCEHSLSDLHPPFSSHAEHLEAVTKDCQNFAPWCTPRLIRADTAAAAALFSDHSVFAVWVDAGHDVDSAAADIRAWRPKICTGGILAGHDLAPSHPGVGKALIRENLPHRPISSRSWIATGPEFTDK